MAKKPKKVSNPPPQASQPQETAPKRKLPVIRVYNGMGRCVGTRPDPSSLSPRARDWNEANEAVGRPWTFFPR